MLRNRPVPLWHPLHTTMLWQPLALWHDPLDASSPGPPLVTTSDVITPPFGTEHWLSCGLSLQFLGQPFSKSPMHSWKKAAFFRRIHWSWGDTEEKCNIENNLKLLLEMPTHKVELATALEGMEIYPLQESPRVAFFTFHWLPLC